MTTDRERAAYIKSAAEVLKKVLQTGDEDVKQSVYSGSEFDRCMEGENAISIENFVFHLAAATRCEIDTLLAAFMLLDKVSGVYSINSMSIHNLFFTALMICIKYIEDYRYTNKYYARVAGLTLQQCNDLERSMLIELDWNVGIPSDTLAAFKELVSVGVSKELRRVV